MSDRASREMDAGLAAGVRTCATCRHFEAPPGLAFGNCNARLPDSQAVDDRPPERTRVVAAGSLCVLHDSRELTQCQQCQHQRTRGPEVSGCGRAPESVGALGPILEALLFEHAKRAPCPCFEQLEYGPDAYRAADLPPLRSNNDALR